MRKSIDRLIASADAIAPLMRPIIHQHSMLAPSDIINALRTAKRNGLDVSVASSQRSVSIIMDHLCATI